MKSLAHVIVSSTGNVSHPYARVLASVVLVLAALACGDDSIADAGITPADGATTDDGGSDSRDASSIDAGADAAVITDAGVDAREPELADYYVALDGDDDNPGTIDQPFATLAAADSVIVPGQLVYVRGATYTQTARLNASGTAEQPIRWEGFPGERAVFEGRGRGATPWAEQIRVGGDYVELRNVEVQDSVGPGIRVFGDYVWVDMATVRRSGTTGINFYETVGGRVSNSLVSTSYNQFGSEGQPADGGGADGISFATCSDGLVTHTITWGNSDDGFDFWESTNMRIEYSVTFGNGINRWAGEGFLGDGNGFKLGGCAARNVVAYRNLSYSNQSRGFDFNCNSMSPLSQCTSYDDSYGFNNGSASNAWNNSVALASRTRITQTMADVPRNNAWDLGIDVTSDDFESTTPPMLTGEETAAEALALFDGSAFMRPRPGSALVDAGEVLGGDAYLGEAPDLGAFEVR